MIDPSLTRILLNLLLLVATTQALMPPLWDDFEPVNVMRRRLGLVFNYTTQHVHPEECRYLTEDQCQRKDELRQHRRRLNAATGENIRVLVLLIKFKNHANMEVPPREYYDELFNGEEESEINPYGSIKEWFRFNSLGKYRVKYDVRDWEVAEQDESYYAAGIAGHGLELEELFPPILTKLDDAGTIDWTNGYVDERDELYHLVVLHSGVIAEVGDRDCVDPPSHKDRIWSAGSGGGGPESWASKDFFQLAGWMITSAWDLPKCEGADKSVLAPLQPMKMNIVCHEYNHGFGLPDLYDGSGKVQNIGGIGKFGIMSSVTGWDFKRETPGYLSAYCRTKVGWVDPIRILQDGVYAIQPLELSSYIYRIDHGFPDGEYLLIESKQEIKWDSDIPGGGIVIYHVDENVDKNKYPYYPGLPQWPAEHYRVAVVQADRKFAIEQGEDGGDKGDFWSKGAVLGSGGEYPNTDAYSTGVLTPTGITIEILTDSRLIMLFQVSGIGTRNANIPDNPESLRGTRDTTGEALEWILSMLAGLGLMVGLVVLLL